MKIFTERIHISTKEDLDIIDMTEDITDIIKKSNIKDGIVNIFSPGSTGGITTMEFEPGLKEDIKTALERIAPSDIDYEHHKTWYDRNGKSHIRSMFIKPELTVPIENNRPILGTWQQVVFLDFDVPAREREIVVKIIGE